MLKNYGTENTHVYIAQELGNILKLSDIRKSIVNYSFKKRIIVDMPRIYHCLDYEGVRRYLFTCRQTIPDQLKEQFDIHTGGNVKYHYPEVEYFKILKKCYKNIKHQYTMPGYKYRLDYYFPEYNLVVECDEYGHSGYDAEKELKRNNIIKSELNNPKIIRFNPYVKNFTIFDVIGKINEYIVFYLKNKVKTPRKPKIED